MAHTLPELFAILTKVNGYDAAVRVSHTGSRVWDAPDSSRIDNNDMYFNVSIKVFGCNDQEATAHAKTLEDALAQLAEKVVEVREKFMQNFSDRYKKSREELDNFNNPPRICGMDASTPFEHATLGTKCTNTMPCPRHGMMGGGGGPYR